MNIREGKREGRIKGIRIHIERELKKDKSMSYQHLLAWTIYNFGISRRTAKDYIDPMLMLEMYKIEGDEISK
jgi:hypothetical protein